MDNREETLINGQKPVKGHITVDQNVKLERLSRNSVFSKTDKDKAKKVRSFIDKNPTEEEANAAIEKLTKQIKEQKETA